MKKRGLLLLCTFPVSIALSTPAFGLDYFSVNDVQVQSAACLALKPPSEQMMADYLESLITNPKDLQTVTVHGTSFSNELTTLINLFDGIHKPSVIADVKLKLPPTKCDKVLCAMEQFYGKKQALMMLYIYAKFGISTSPSSAVNPLNYQKWKLDELTDVLTALETIPSSVLTLKSGRLLRFLKGYTLKKYLPDDIVYANARIDIFDPWINSSRLKRISILIHEFGHVLSYELHNLDDSSNWKNMPKEYVSRYAKTNNAEDFAESFLAYRIAPQHLKNISPARYDYIKNKVFKGLEFNKNQNCMEPFLEFNSKIKKTLGFKREIQQWSKDSEPRVIKEVARQEQIGYYKKKVWDQCGALYMNEVLQPTSKDLTNACIENAVIGRAARVEAIRQEKEVYLESHFFEFPRIKISKRFKTLLRQELKHTAIVFIKYLYKKMDFPMVDSCKRDAEYIAKYNKDATFAPDAIEKILYTACAESFNKSILRSWLGPDFNNILP